MIILTLAICFILITGLFFFIRWLWGIWRLSTIAALMAPAIFESIPFFKLITLLFGKSSHAMERHSPMTKIDQHIKRAKKGITPEGIRLSPVNSGRWHSYYPMLYAIESALTLWKEQNPKRKTRYVFHFNKDIGVVVKRLTKERIETQIAFVIINKAGHVITAFPVIESLDNIKDVIFLSLEESRTLETKKDLPPDQ